MRERCAGVEQMSCSIGRCPLTVSVYNDHAHRARNGVIFAVSAALGGGAPSVPIATMIRTCASAADLTFDALSRALPAPARSRLVAGGGQLAGCVLIFAGCQGPRVDLAFRELRHLSIRLFLLAQTLGETLRHFIFADRLGVGTDGAVAGDAVMRDLLRVRQQRGVPQRIGE